MEAESKGGSVVPFVLLTYAISWGAWIGGWLYAGRPETLEGVFAWLILGSFGPGLAALILLVARGEGVWPWLRRFVKVRAGWRAYLLAFLPLPFACLALTVAFGFQPIEGQPPAMIYATLFPISILNGLFAAFIGAGPLGEEGGWRGYMLPRLLPTQGVLGASLTVGIVWGLWHLPVMWLFADWRGDVAFWPFLGVYMLGVLPLSYAFTRLWIVSGGSLFTSVWFHGIVNACGGFAFQWAWAAPHGPLVRMLIFTGAIWITALVFAVVFRERGDREPSVSGTNCETD